MTSGSEIGLALGPPIVTYALGLISPRARQQIRTRRSREFWRPYSRGELKVVIGSFDEFPDWERSGLIGAGDVRALAELQQIFNQNHLGQLPVVFSPHPEPKLVDATHLIAVGGPDVNWVARELLRRQPGRFHFGNSNDHEISITDTATGRQYPPQGAAIDCDFGVIRLMRSPFDPQFSSLVVAGVFGYGTWAGIRLLREPAFLTHPDVHQSSGFECLFSADVVGDEPIAPKIEVVQGS